MDGPKRGQRVVESLPNLPDGYMIAPLAEVDPEIDRVLRRELERQRNTLETIASENFVPQAVLEAVGSVLTNKYAEGYPGKRHYGGCQEVDVAEQLAIDRAKELFGPEDRHPGSDGARPGRGAHAGDRPNHRGGARRQFRIRARVALGAQQDAHGTVPALPAPFF